MNNGSFSTGGQAQNPTFGTVVVTAALQLNAGAVFELYNTADKTNYERLRADWSGNVARIQTQNGGAGSLRAMQLTAGTTLTLQGGLSATQLTFGSSGSAATHFAFTVPNATGSSGIITSISLAPTMAQSGTAGYTAFDINPTESATGSGTKLLQRWAVGGSPVATLDKTGVLNVISMRNAGSYGLGSSFGVSDVVVTRDAADTLAQRRTTNAQTFRGYETYTDASNYSRWYQTFSGGFAYYGTQAAGTGTRRPLIVQHFTTTVAALPAAATAGAGSRAVVSDATAPAFGVAVVGGGAVVSPVYSDGANWIVG